MATTIAGVFLASILSLPTVNADTSQGSADALQIQPIGPFGGLNTNISQEAIDATQSPDLLNVDITQGGKSVKKRQGYGLDAVLASTEATHNLYKFFDSSGNEVRLAFNDTLVSASVNGATWAVILTTGTKGATWDCTDYLGFAYCVSSAFDNPIKTNGTSAGTTGAGGTNAVPAGSLVSNSGDRLLVGATAANPSRLYYSQSAVFSNFTLGIQPSDSSFEDIVAPGSKLTHLAYRFGRWLWWKDQSFGFFVGTGQFDLQIITVSHTIGTLDNTDVFDGNYVYFRGSDAQIYTYDGSVLSRAISTDIGPTLRTANRRKANQWAQTSATDFSAGASVPAINISTTISPGDVTVSSFGVAETSSAQWVNGTSSNITINSSNLSLSTADTNMTNPGFETNDFSGWSFVGAGGTIVGSGGTFCPLSPQSGSKYFSGLNVGQSPFHWLAYAYPCLGSTATATSSVDLGNFSGCSWAQYTLQMNGDKNLSYQVGIYTSDGQKILESNCFIADGTPITMYAAGSANPVRYNLDTFAGGVNSVTTGFYTSKTYDTLFTSSTYQLQTSWTTSGSSPTFSIATSSALAGPFVPLLTSTGTSSVGNRYAQWSSTISVTNSSTSVNSSISNGTIIAKSTGTYYSSVNNAPLLTTWGSFNADDNSTATSSITYYVRASTNSFSILSSTPSWVLQPKGGTVITSTGTFMQLRADFYVANAAESPTLNDFTFNWFEGSASEKIYGTYFNNAIWFSMSLGTTSTNNRIFRYDLLSNVWTLYDIPANGFLTYNNNLYFASPAAGKVFQFGNGVFSDDGSAINAYWKSKAFFGDSPFTDKDLRRSGWYVASDPGATLSLTYTMDEKNTASQSFSLSDSRKNVIHKHWNFPLGSLAINFNAKFGDNSTNPPWEVFGGAIQFVPRPWEVDLQ